MNLLIPFAGEPNNNINTEFVRQGLRAVVSGRNQSGIRTPQSPLAGSIGGNSPASASQIQAGQSPQQSQPASQMPNTSASLMNNANDMDSMRFNFDIPQTGE